MTLADADPPRGVLVGESQPGASTGTRTIYTLAAGVELCGEYEGSGHVESRHLVRRSDGRMVEVSDLVYEVAATLGTGDVDAVATAVSAAFDRPITADGVVYLVEHKLVPLGLVATATATAPRPAPGPPVLGIAGRRGVVPRAIVGRIADTLSPLFLPAVVTAVLLGLAASDAWLVTAGHRPGGEIARLVLDPGLLLLVVGLTLASSLFHELGHATASRYGGAEPGVIGVGVYLLWPVFFNDLNDSYRLSRTGRIRADLGGVYFNVVFVLGLVATYAVTGFQPLVIAIFAQHLLILQQFLPFVRLDGYYLVSDVAGVPNLFGHIRPTIARWIPGRRRDLVVSPLRPGPRRIVTAWVLVTVPLLGAALVLLVAGLPNLVRAGAESAGTNTRLFGAALGDADVVAALASALHLTFLAILFTGLAVVVFRVGRRIVLPRPPTAPAVGVVQPARRTEADTATGAWEDEVPWLATAWSCHVRPRPPAVVLGAGEGGPG